MDLKAAQLRHFVNVASSGSYKEAARQGFRSQPAVSLALKTLETQIGAPLFENGRRVVLTGLGAAIFPLVEEYLQHHDRLARAIKRAARGEGGEISSRPIRQSPRTCFPQSSASTRAAILALLSSRPTTTPRRSMNWLRTVLSI